MKSTVPLHFNTEPGNPRGMHSLFPSMISRPHKGDMSFEPVQKTLITAPRRLESSEEFLRQNRRRIKIFADIGPANASGAVTTYRAKHILGHDSKVYAVDIQKLDKDKAAEHELVRTGKLDVGSIKPLVHAISRKPLPSGIVCDAIRCANVFQYMTPSETASAIRNIWLSLRFGGYFLAINGVQEMIFRKTKSGFMLIINRSAYI